MCVFLLRFLYSWAWAHVVAVQCGLKHLDCSTKLAMILAVLDIALYKSGQMSLPVSFSTMHTFISFTRRCISYVIGLDNHLLHTHRLLTNTV